MQLPEVVPTAHANDTAFVMHSDVGDESELPVHDAPVYAVVDGVRMMVLPVAALLYAVIKLSGNTVIVPAAKQYE